MIGARPSFRTALGAGLLCLIDCLLPAGVNGQLRNANWINSTYWITFASGAPENLPPPPYFSVKASLSDTAGNLALYFVDGNGGGPSPDCGVRDPEHQLIPGNPAYEGYFAGLTSQSAIFIPKPSDSERAYLVAWNRTPLGETRRFGLLEVFLGNESNPPQVVSEEYTWFFTGATGKCMVIPHSNGVDYWFVGQLEGTNEYHACLINDTGLSPTPVISTAGAVIPEDFTGGKLIPSVDGTRFVSVSETPGFTEPTVLPSEAELFSFDPGTGFIEHLLTLDVPARIDGVEFSPSGRFLYVMYWLYSNPVVSHALYQYDLEAADPNAAPLLMDSYVVPGLSGFSTNIIGQAPDGRVYVSHYVQSVGVISEPDSLYPQCDYVHDGYLASGVVLWTPSFIKSYHDDPAVGPMGVTPSARAVQASVLPNPLSGTGELRWPSASGPLTLQWMDAQGRLLRNDSGQAGDGRVPIDAGGLAPGQYLLRVLAPQQNPFTVRVSVAN